MVAVAVGVVVGVVVGVAVGVVVAVVVGVVVAVGVGVAGAVVVGVVVAVGVGVAVVNRLTAAFVRRRHCRRGEHRWTRTGSGADYPGTYYRPSPRRIDGLLVQDPPRRIASRQHVEVCAVPGCERWRVTGRHGS